MAVGTRTMVKDNNVDFALKRLRVKAAGNLSIVRKKSEGYMKPGVRIREEKKINTMNSRKKHRY